MTTKKSPVIGMTGPSYFSKHVQYTIEKFFEANPFKLCQNTAEDLDYWLDQCDAVIVAGGTDIHPRTYGYAVLNNYNFRNFDVKRDRREMYIIKYCLRTKIPMMGICRGHQMIGVAHGMDFIADLTDGLVCHQPNSQNISHDPDEPMHWVRLCNTRVAKQFRVEDTLAEVLPGKNSANPDYLWVNSFHHQALAYNKDEKRVMVLGTATGVEKRQIVELMKGRAHPWLSCQWHPEYDWEENAASNMVLSRFRDMIAKK